MNEVDAAKPIGDFQKDLSIVWTLTTGFEVVFMQAGFALVETGSSPPSFSSASSPRRPCIRCTPTGHLARTSK